MNDIETIDGKEYFGRDKKDIPPEKEGFRWVWRDNLGDPKDDRPMLVRVPDQTPDRATPDS